MIRLEVYCAIEMSSLAVVLGNLRRIMMRHRVIAEVVVRLLVILYGRLVTRKLAYSKELTIGCSFV